ncbi:hypothetical protein ACNKHV_07980 [Shigella flexneri]
MMNWHCLLFNNLAQLRCASASGNDFGTGYSSLSQLARFPIPCHQTYQVFVQIFTSNPSRTHWSGRSSLWPRGSNLQVMAEGVESAKEDAFLTRNGINERQGIFVCQTDARRRLRTLV